MLKEINSCVNTFSSSDIITSATPTDIMLGTGNVNVEITLREE